MKIKDLYLTNFSSHAQSILRFETPCALIVGTLAAGKSSIKDAIEYALTGECGYYRKRTDDRTELIHEMAEQKNMAVDLVTDKGRAYRSKSALAESWTWNDQPKQNAQAMDTAISEAFSVSKTILSAALNVSNFFELDGAAQKELVIGLVGAEVTHEKVIALFTGDPDALKLLHGPVTSLQAIQNAYQYAFERRTVVKRELKELKPPAAPEGPAPPIDKIRALLAQIEGALEEKVREKGRLEGSAQTAAVRARLTEQVAEYRKVAHPGDGKEFHEVRNTVVAERTAAAQATIAAEAEVANARAELALRQKNAQLLNTFNGRCVAGDHSCPATPRDMRTALELQERLQVKADKQLQMAVEKWTELRRLRDNDANLLHAESNIRAHEKAVERHRLAQQETQRIEKELAGMPTATAGVDPLPVIEGEILQLRTRISKGKQQLGAAQSWLERERQVKAVAEQRATKERELTHLEELVEFFGPKGVKVQLIDERIGRFVGQINEQLKHFGFTVEIIVEPWRILKDGRPLSRLSRSERFRMGVAFQIAVAKMTGLNFVVCDDAELLTPEARGQMMRMLIGAGLDQAIVIMTLMDVPKFLAKPPGLPVQTFMVRNEAGVSLVERLVTIFL